MRFLSFPAFLIFYMVLVTASAMMKTDVFSLSPRNKISYWEIEFTNVKKQKVSLFCELAVTKKEKARGLMFRKRLDKNAGMVFIYSKPRVMHFWMRNTGIPLSIAFVSKEHIITEIYDMKAYDERIVSSSTKVIYAIEANRGWFKKNYIFPRTKIKIIPH